MFGQPFFGDMAILSGRAHLPAAPPPPILNANSPWDLTQINTANAKMAIFNSKKSEWRV